MKWRKSLNITTDRCGDPDFLKMLRGCGFDGVDLNFSGGFFQDVPRQVETICENLTAAGLACAQIHLPTYGLFADSGTDDPEMEKRIETALSIMPTLDVHWAAAHVRSTVESGFDRERAMEDNIRWLKRLCGIAETYGVGIAVENLPTFPDRPDAPFFSSRIEDQCDLIDAVDHPLLGACWDFGHANLNIQHKDKSQQELLLTLGKRLKLVHAHSNYATRDSHLPPTIGTMDWVDALTGLKKIGFDGFFSLECGCGGGNPKISEAYCEFCGKTTDAIFEELE
ncbi:MAG: sugar phosphate isomerase/epimerase [Oscillospiraceae bacterium]|nr:sugar phosphate isomerase/epimerase [Oscillospiraceae bacterium]